MIYPRVSVRNGIQRIIWGCVFVFTLLVSDAFAQLPSKSGVFVISPVSNTIQLDLLTATESIVVMHSDSLIASHHYTFFPASGTLAFHWPRHWPSFPVEIQVFWRYLPISVENRYALFDRSVIDHGTLSDTITTISATTAQFRRTQERAASAVNPALSSRGSITRGIIVGSNRDLALESGLRFELTGPITDDVTITAVLSDQNSLIQPDGSTQNLREFDQVYIRLASSKSVIQLGDTDVNLNQSEIARINRRIQGAEVSVQLSPGSRVTSAAAIVRGRYNVTEFQGRQGVQGPYRMTGVNGELFVMIVAGTEKVYLDGRLLTRGEDHDYIFDYSIGELFFTSKRLIRATDRIRVEYQYLANSYARSLLASEVHQSGLAGDRLTLGVTFIREADNTFLDDISGLSDADLQILRNAGSDRGLMRTSGVDSVGFRPDAPFVLYSRIDTMFNGQTVPVYVHQPGNIANVWRVQFSRVPSGAGSYRRSSVTTNGIVYEWVGQGGDYEPFRQLEGPQLRQIFSVNAQVKLLGNLTYYTEVGTSMQNENRFSTEEINRSAPMYVNRLRLGNLRYGDNLVISGYLSHEYKGKDFAFFDPVREVEFDRNWNIDSMEKSFEQRIGGGLELEYDQAGKLQYDINHIERTHQLGVRQQASMLIDGDRFPSIDIEGSYLNSSNSLNNQTTDWVKLRGGASYAIPVKSVRLTPYYQFSVENKQEQDTHTEAFLNGSLAFSEHEPGIRFVVSERLTVSGSVGERLDYGVLNGTLQKQYQTLSRNADLAYDFGNVWTNRTRIAHQVRTTQASFAEQSDERIQGLALRTDNKMSLFRNLVQGTLIYDVSTQSRSVLQESYLEVGPEFGQYVWRDLNNDGIKQFDEFFPETTPNEGHYIRQMLPTDELLPVIVMTGSTTLRVDPTRSVSRTGNSVLSRWILTNTAYETRFSISEQSRTKNQEDIYLLKPSAFLSDETTLSGRYSWLQRMDLLKGSRRYDLRVEHEINEHLSEFTAGSEYSKSVISFADMSMFYSEAKRIESRFGWRYMYNSSDQIVSRNYDIRGWFIQSGLDIQPNSGIQLDIKVRYSSLEDRSQLENVALRAYQIEQRGTVSVTKNLNIQYRIEYRNMNLTGVPSPLGEFEITEGAGRGTSWLWSGRMLWRSSTNVRTTLTYDGRTGVGIEPVHTIRIAASATF